MSPQKVDITPTPRILRTLGEIPFLPWQCIAELVDNSIDAFADADRTGMELDQRLITVAWSSEAVGLDQRSIEVADTGPGMSLEQLNNAARAGYSANDPVSSLGLFGMGFNIATARLGETTRLMSTRPGDPDWVGIEIDFPTLVRQQSFSAPVIVEPKTSPQEHGTKITVSHLKEGMYSHLRDHDSDIRRQLEVVYSPTLELGGPDIIVQGRRLNTRSHCTWSGTRFVLHQGERVPARIEIDEDLGTALFDLERNVYLSADEEIETRARLADTGTLPPGVIERHKRLTGWVGIQRYSDPNEFGLDFIRNGRKILIGNKSLFSYENPMTSTSLLEYPIELGSTVGGRIVGELHVDYLRPTYQKNDFDRTDRTWQATVEGIRGVGPMLPKNRTGMGFTEPNRSPLGLLVNAYRRAEPGTRSLFVERVLAQDYTTHFRHGEQEYLNDDKWWEAAQEADRDRATNGGDSGPEVDLGARPSDDAASYLGGAERTGTGDASPVSTHPQLDGLEHSADSAPETSSLSALLASAEPVQSWSGIWSYRPNVPGLKVKVWELRQGDIVRAGRKEAYAFFPDGFDCDFIFNPRHVLLAQYVVDPRELLAACLADSFNVRDNLIDGVEVLCDLMLDKCPDLRVDRPALQESAAALFDQVAERLCAALAPEYVEVVNCIKESQGETEELVTSLLSCSSLIGALDRCEPSAIQVLLHAPRRTLIRVVDRFAPKLFDGRVFAAPYNQISLPDPRATERARAESKDRIMSFLKDALWVIGQTGSHGPTQRSRHELARSSHSISLLSQEIGG